MTLYGRERNATVHLGNLVAASAAGARVIEEKEPLTSCDYPWKREGET